MVVCMSGCECVCVCLSSYIVFHHYKHLFSSCVCVLCSFEQIFSLARSFCLCRSQHFLFTVSHPLSSRLCCVPCFSLSLSRCPSDRIRWCAVLDSFTGQVTFHFGRSLSFLFLSVLKANLQTGQTAQTGQYEYEYRLPTVFLSLFACRSYSS